MKNRFDLSRKSIQVLSNKEADIYICKEGVEDFINDNFKLYRGYYISDLDIEEIMNESEESYKDVILDMIPDKTNIKSGEFGEITATEIYISSLDRNNIHIIEKLKHYRKEDTKTAAHKTDILIIEKSSQGFIIHSSEVKTKITDSRFNPIEEMIDGVRDDIVSRIAETINWEKRKLKSEKKFKKLKFIKEVIDNLEKQVVDNNYNGAVFIDKSKLDYEMSKHIYPDVTLRKNQIGKYTKELISIGCKIDEDIVNFEGVKIEDIYKLNVDSIKKKSIERLYNKSQEKLEYIDDINIQIVVFDNINKHCIDMYEKIINIGGV